MHDFIDRLLERHQADRALLASFGETAHEFTAIELLVRAIALHHAQLRTLDLFVGREAVGALQTNATTSDAGAVTRLARVDDLVITRPALWTTHSGGTLSSTLYVAASTNCVRNQCNARSSMFFDCLSAHQLSPAPTRSMVALVRRPRQLCDDLLIAA